ncbi:MAG: hypothetical protein ACKO4V_03855 [Planctomycetota bacterium]
MRELVDLTCVARRRIAHSLGMDKGKSISKVHQVLVAAFSLFLGILLARAMGF